MKFVKQPYPHPSEWTVSDCERALKEIGRLEQLIAFAMENLVQCPIGAAGPVKPDIPSAISLVVPNKE